MIISDVAEEFSLGTLIERARGLAVPGERHILGITGAPGAGKSTVAAQIVAALGSDLAVFVPMDGFHLATVVLQGLGRRDRKGAHDTFDDAGYAHLLARLHRSAMTPGRPGSTDIVYAPEFRRELEEPVGSATPVHPQTPLVVTEGNYLLLDRGAWPRARACIDETWFPAPSDDARRHRPVVKHEARQVPRRRSGVGARQRSAQCRTDRVDRRPRRPGRPARLKPGVRGDQRQRPFCCFRQ